MSVDEPSVWHYDQTPRPAPSRCDHDWRREVVGGVPDLLCQRCWSWHSAVARSHPHRDLDGDSNLESTGNREGQWVVWDDYGWGPPVRDEQ